MHHLRESRKVVVGDAGVLCGVIGWLGCHSCYHTTGRLGRGMTRRCTAQVYWRHGTTRLKVLVTMFRYPFPDADHS